MELLQFKFPSRFLEGVKVAVHEADCEEKSLVSALEGSEDLSHPVDHFGSVNSCDLVSL